MVLGDASRVDSSSWSAAREHVGVRSLSTIPHHASHFRIVPGASRIGSGSQKTLRGARVLTFALIVATFLQTFRAGRRWSRRALALAVTTK